MSTTNGSRRWRKSHAERLGRHTLRESGRRSDVADALGRSISTISHEVTDRCHPELAAAFTLMLDLERHPSTGARSFLDAVEQIVTLAEIEGQTNEAFIARGVYLLDAEDQTCHEEDIAARMSQADHAEALLKHGSLVMELAAYLADAPRRGIDLHAEWRARKCPGRQQSHTGACSPRGDARKVARRPVR